MFYNIDYMTQYINCQSNCQRFLCYSQKNCYIYGNNLGGCKIIATAFNSSFFIHQNAPCHFFDTSKASLCHFWEFLSHFAAVVYKLQTTHFFQLSTNCRQLKIYFSALIVHVAPHCFKSSIWVNPAPFNASISCTTVKGVS